MTPQLSSSIHLRVALALMLAGSLARPAFAQDPDLTTMDLADLLRVEITSLSRRPQSLASAPAAIFVISDQDILRSGASSIPELLRLVPGLQVARYNNSKWSVSARGLGGYYSSKLLVLVDGRSVYTPHFSGVFWEHLDMPLDDIERIEVQRGPGGTMWGANAVNGVINIITKSAASTSGGLAVVSVGSEDRGLASVRFGDRAGDWAYRVYAKGSLREFKDSALASDSNDHARVGFRLDRDGTKHSLTLQGDVFRAQLHTPVTLPQLTAPYLRVLDDSVHADGVNLVGRWTRFNAPRNKMTLQAYYDRNVRKEFLIDFRTETADVDFQHQIGIGDHHDVVWGAEYRQNFADITSSTVMRYEPGRTNRHLLSAFAQDEVRLGESLAVTVGAKVEHYEDVGSSIGPNVRAMWSPGANHRVWGSIARAVRTPSLADEMATFLYTVVPPSAATMGLPVQIDLVGNPVAQPLEGVVAYEGGYRVMPFQTLSVDVTAFRNLYDRLSSYTRSPVSVRLAGGIPYLSIQSTHSRLIAGESHGMETVATWTPMSRWSISGSTTLLKVDLHVTDPTVNTGGSLAALITNPNVQFTGRSLLRVTNDVQLDGTVHYVGPVQGNTVKAFSRVDLRAGWSISPVITLDAGVQNLFDDAHVEAARNVYWASDEIRRSGYARLSWRF